MLIFSWSCLQAWIRWSICISKSQRNWCITFSMMDSGLCWYYLFACLNFKHLHISHWNTFSIQSCLIWYSYCGILLHLLMVWFNVSSFSLSEFSPPAFAYGLSFESKWAHVTNGHRKFSLYSGWSKRCCSLDGLFSSCNFQFF